MTTVFILLLMIITVNCQDEECYAKHEDMFGLNGECVETVEPSMVRFRRIDTDKNKKLTREEVVRLDWCRYRYLTVFRFCGLDTNRELV